MKTPSPADPANYLSRYISNYLAGDPIPAPEVIEDDPASSWRLWDESVNESDFLHEMRYAPTSPAPLSALG